MPLTAAMMTGFSGIAANGIAVDTIGNNLANLNTTAFKGQRTLFETLLYKTISEGEAPSADSGGTLPNQVGTGTAVSSLQRNFVQGGFEGTGFPSDLAIAGDGFFVLNQGAGELVYTRDGSFRLDQTQTLVSTGGLAVQIFPADQNGVIDTTSLSDLVIPLGSASAAIPTTQVSMDGRLNSNTNVASAGAVSTSQVLVTAAGTPATAGTALTDLVNNNMIPFFANGDVVTIQGIKGGITLPERTFVVGTSGSTLGDFASFLESALAIETDPAVGGTPGVVIGDGTTFPEGALVIQSNFGEINGVELSIGSVTNTTGALTSPFRFATTSAAIGGGVTTSFQVFDSLGNPVDVRLRAVMESKSDTGTVWRFYAESVNDSDLSPLLGTGTLTFDAEGQFVSSTGTNLSIDRAGVGSVTPLSFTMDLSALTGLASTNGTSDLIMNSQNGAPAGILTGYSIDQEGIITVTYSNQLTEVLGQISLATFANNEGLIALSQNQFTFGPDSGDANLIPPRTGSAGSVIAGSLEQSNVDIAREFINLITASTGISSASRVVRVADELLQELLLLAR